ncbi:MAG TPA: UbiD family decarboxylase [Methanocorpusculum sp.]|nr:UbiD family decarboxylase [Methanocorpusculum sp.]
MTDLSTFIQNMTAAGLADTISRPVSADMEAAELASKTDRMLIFENIDGHTVVMNTVTSHKALALALGMPEDRLIPQLSKCTFSGNVVDGDPLVFEPADLDKIPVLKHYPRDAGKYLTSGIVFSAYDGVENASVHRMLVLDKNHLAARIVERRHTDILYRKACADGKNLPIAIVIGVDPAILFAACTRVPEGCEMQYAAEITGRPLTLHECPNGIKVPDAEIVLYGWMTTETAIEGPFVDISGTYDSVRRQPIIELEGMYLKPGFIYHALLPGGAEHKMFMGAPYEPKLYAEIGTVVDIDNVTLTRGGAGYFHAVISIRKHAEDDGRKAIDAAFAAHKSLKHVVVVDTDIDIENPVDVEYAIATRIRADQDVVIYTGVPGSTIDPCRIGDGLNVKAGIDATIPLGREEDFIRAEWKI